MLGNGVGITDLRQKRTSVPVNLPLLTGVTGKAYGGVTFSRGSTQYVPDFEGVVRPVMAGCPAIGGARIVTNLTTNSEFPNGLADATRSADVTAVTLAGYSGAMQTGEGKATKYIYRNNYTCVPGNTYVFSAVVKMLDGTVPRTGAANDPNVDVGAIIAGMGATAATPLSVTPVGNGAYRCSWRVTATTFVSNNFGITQGGNNSGKAFITTAFQVENVTSQSIQTAGEYIKTGTAPLTQCFATRLDGAPIPNIFGLLCEPTAANKCTCYGTIPADTLGVEKITSPLPAGTGASASGTTATLAGTSSDLPVYQSGAVIIGRVYQAVVTVSGLTAGGNIRLKFGTTPGVFTTESLSANGTFTSIISMPVTLDTDIARISCTVGTAATVVWSVKEVQFAVNTKSFYSSTSAAWVNNHTNITLSGEQAAVLTTVDGTADLAPAGLLPLSQTGKWYDLDNTAGASYIYATFVGPSGNTNPHSLSVIAQKVSGAGVASFYFNNGEGAVDITSTLKRYKSENVTPSLSQVIKIGIAAGVRVRFFLPQLEQTKYTTSPIPTSGATATRAATALSFPVARNLKTNNFTLAMTCTLAAPPQADFRTLQTTLDGNNYCFFGFTLSSVVFTSNVASVFKSDYLTTTTSITQGVTYKFAVRKSSTGGGVVAVDGTLGTVDATNTRDLVYGSTVELATSSTVCGYIKNLRIFNRCLSDSELVTITT